MCGDYMKFKYFTILIAFVLLLTSCSGNNGIINDIQNLIDDPNAESGILDIEVTVEFFRRERDNAINQRRLFEDGRDSMIESGSIPSADEFNEFIRFFEEYERYASLFVDAGPDNIEGKFFGIKNMDEDSGDGAVTSITPSIFVYTFSDNDNIGSGIDFDFLNQYFSELQDGEIDNEETWAEKTYVIARGNILVTVAGRYLDRLDEIKRIIDDNI